MLTLAAQDTVMKVEALRHADQVRSSREEDADMEYLVGIAPNVKGSGELALRPACLQR